jgi:hypothetical protein
MSTSGIFDVVEVRKTFARTSKSSVRPFSYVLVAALLLLPSLSTPAGAESVSLGRINLERSVKEVGRSALLAQASFQKALENSDSKVEWGLDLSDANKSILSLTHDVAGATTTLNKLVGYYKKQPNSVDSAFGVSACIVIEGLLTRISQAWVLIETAGAQLSNNLENADLAAAKVNVDAIETYTATITRTVAKMIAKTKLLPDI